MLFYIYNLKALHQKPQNEQRLADLIRYVFLSI
jgi:hypothetical protein